MRPGSVAAGAAVGWMVAREAAYGALAAHDASVASGLLHLLCITGCAVYGVHSSGVNFRRTGALEAWRLAVRPALMYALLGTLAAVLWTFVLRGEVQARAQAEREAAVQEVFATDASFEVWREQSGAPEGIDRETALASQLEGIRTLEHPGVFIGMHLLGLAWAAALVVAVLTAVWRGILGR